MGEIALLRGTARTATVRTLERCIVLCLRKEDMTKFLTIAPEVGPLLERFVEQRLQTSETVYANDD